MKVHKLWEGLHVMSNAPHKPEPLLWLSDSRGQYLPRDFATCFSDRDKYVSGVTKEEWAILEAGPDHAEYWDTWNDVEANAIVTDHDGTVWTLYQDGDLWLVPKGMEWSEEEGGFVWPSEEEEEE